MSKLKCHELLRGSQCGCFYAEDVDDCAYPELRLRVEKVLALHKPRVTWANSKICDDCLQGWPCPTVRLLNGEDL